LQERHDSSQSDCGCKQSGCNWPANKWRGKAFPAALFVQASSLFEGIRYSAYVEVVSAADVIKELEELPLQEREKVLRWLQQQGLKDLWIRADELMKDAPKFTEDEILKLPRVRPSGF
jgi:hypothetical protein